MAKKKRAKKLKGFSIQFVPYSEIKGLKSSERIKKILDTVMENEILILQGRLDPSEESRLIGETMEAIDKKKNFRGVELAVISGNGEVSGFFGKLKRNFLNVLAGGDVGALTILGPATIVKEIKRDPRKIELFLNK